VERGEFEEKIFNSHNYALPNSLIEELLKFGSVGLVHLVCKMIFCWLSNYQIKVN